MTENRKLDIAMAAKEYRALQVVLAGIEAEGEEAREFLNERSSRLVRRLIALSASSGEELAHKAAVLLDWITADDMTSQLTASLCRDTVHVFPVTCGQVD